jgi:hypothetical protein
MEGSDVEIDSLIAAAAQDNLVDPSDVAERVSKQLSRKQKEEAFPLLLREHVVKWFSQQRMNANANTGQGRNETHTPSARKYPKPGVGTRVKRVRDYWAEQLRQQISIGTGTNKTPKMMGDCTVSDLRWLAAERKNRAFQLSTNSARYARWADALEKSGKRSLKELKAEPK